MNEQLAALKHAARWLRQIESDRIVATAQLDAAIEALRASGTTWTAINETAQMTNAQVSYERRSRKIRQTA